MAMIGKAIYERKVNVRIVLSNPYSIPANLSPVEASYGNGWTCEDVEAQIINITKEHIQQIDEEKFTRHLEECLQISFLRGSRGDCDWYQSVKGANHAKFF